MWDLWRTNCHGDRFLSKYFVFLTAVSFHKCFILIHSYINNTIKFQIITGIIQGVPGGMDKIRESVPYVELYRYNPKHLYPKFNGYGDNGHRKVWASGVST